MTTTVYTKTGFVVRIDSDNVSIPANPENRDYRKLMVQDSITPFERVEIVDPEPQPPTIEERLAAVEMALLEVAGV